jgi:hypothetical protein
MACEICGSDQDVRCCPVMTGDRFGEPVKHPVCVLCIRAWYEGGETTPEGILRVRLAERAK